MATTSSARNATDTPSKEVSGSIVGYFYTLEENPDFDKIVFLPKAEVQLNLGNLNKGSVCVGDERIPVAVLFDNSELTPEQLTISLNAEKLDSVERRLLVQMGRMRSAEFLQDNAMNNCRTIEVKEEYRNIQDALPEEEEKVKSLYSLFEPVGKEVSDSTGSSLNHPEQHDSAADQVDVIWESPFQYAKLSMVPVDRIIREEDHPDSLRECMADCQKCGLFCDLEIRGRGSTSAIKCHSVILCAVSPAIKTRICSKLHRGSELNFENIPHEILIQLVDYAYTGSMTLDGGNVLSVYSAADFLDIGVLVTAASKFLTESTEMFDGVSCYKVCRFLEQHVRLQPLILMYKRRMMEHIAEVFSSDECLVDMNIELVIEVLESDFVDFGSETEVIRAMSRWVSVDRSREGCMPELASRIRWNDIEQERHSEDVTAFERELRSTGKVSCSQPKIGSRNGGMSGGFLLVCDQVDFPLIVDLQSQKIKVLPKYPELVYEPNRDEAAVDSDDGVFYIVSESRGKKFDLLRLDVLENRWDHVLQHELPKNYEGLLTSYSVLAGKLCLTWMCDYDDWIQRRLNEPDHPHNAPDYSIKCLDLTTSKVEFHIKLDDCIGSGVSTGLCSIFSLYTSGKLTRFDARTCTLSDVKIDDPSDQLSGCSAITVNTAGQALIYDRRTTFLVCLDSLESGRLIHLMRLRRTGPLIQDSILNWELVEEEPPKETHQRLQIFRDRGLLGGWNVFQTYSLVRPDWFDCFGCHFTRGLIKNLPDFLQHPEATQSGESSILSELEQSSSLNCSYSSD